MLPNSRGALLSGAAFSLIFILFLSGFLPQFANLPGVSDYTDLIPTWKSTPERPVVHKPLPDNPLPTPSVSDSRPSESSSPDPDAILGSFYGLPELCTATKWTEGLWLHCHSYCGANKTSVCGGLNNARNRIQTCLRLAIDLGAGIILPSATTRNKDHLLDTNQMTVCPEHFWNVKYLETEMGKYCPQLQIRQCDDRRGIKHEVLTENRGYLSYAHHAGTFRDHIHKAFETANVKVQDVSINNQAVVNFGDSYIGWNYRDADELFTIRKALFKVLLFNESLLNISKRISKSPELEEGKYIGVHLRGESDWPASFGSADDQMRLYSEKIRNSTTKSVYVSCGDGEVIQKFRDMLTPFGFRVHDKSTLLVSYPALLQKVEELGFDQKAIVEYETLVEAEVFMGVIMSSMSSLIAYAREVDQEGHFFVDHVFPGSSESGQNRIYPEVALKGSNTTMLMVVNGVDIMNYFP